jgi:hypothetical protein
MTGPGKEYLWVAVVEEEDGWNLHFGPTLSGCLPGTFPYPSSKQLRKQQ